MEEVLKYLQNQLVQAPFRLRTYVQDEQGKKYPQRNIYIKIDKYLKDFLHNPIAQDRWIIIPGLRGVGKTTIVAQLFLNHYQEVDQQRMLYISLDEVVNVLGSSLKDVLVAYERILGESFEKLTRPLFIFIDEAQYDPKWASVLKTVYDRSNKVFVVCSGSSAVSLQTNPDVIRRSIFQKLFPTSFTEFLMIRDGKFPIKDLKKNLKDALFNANSAKDAYEKLQKLEQNVIGAWSSIDRHYVDEYLKIGTLPFAIRMKDEARVYQTISLLLDKVINQDVQSLGRFDAKTLIHIKRVLFLLAESDVVSVQKLSKTLETSVNTVSNILEVLEQAELLIRVMPYGSNSKKVRKPSRYQFMSSAMRSAFLSIAGNEQIFIAQKGRLMEDVVAMTLHREFVASSRGALNHDSSKGSADFILTIAGKNIIPIEIGMGEKLGTQVRNTMKKVGSAKYGVVICQTSLKLLEDANVVKVPLDYFLLI
ncbi:MAG: ATP-binding protein [Candidatus Magasanikbacteria bacterium]|nr:ATP-binding protein [Candidatus Magasanikbacteria bacterium]